MELTKENIITLIKKQFAALQTTEDLVSLLNVAKTFLYPSYNTSKKFTLQSINYYAFHKKDERYLSFEIPKKRGGTRLISSPNRTLKLIQKCLNFALSIVFVPHVAANGFVMKMGNKTKNIATNAKVHVNKPFVYNIDLTDFFPSVSFRRVKTVLALAPFNLSDDLAFLIANLCCDNGVLPQGAPTSPVLTNVVCQRLDRKLYAFAKTNKIRYSRYADDITFSGYDNIFTTDFLEQIKQIIEVEENFTINTKKIRLQTRFERQEVTGLTVNQKVNVEQKRIRTIRAMLHNWREKGLEEAEKKFKQCYHPQKNGGSIPPFQSVLLGNLEYLKMVRGNTDFCYLKYWEEYLILTNKKTKNATNIDNINSCLHNPQNVTSFLSEFRKKNIFNLKELLHAPDSPENFDLEPILTDIKNRLPFKAGKDTIPFDKRLPLHLWKILHNQLFSVYSGRGRRIWKKYGIHPLFNDKAGADIAEFKDKIQNFRRNIRFGKSSDDSDVLLDSLKELVTKTKINSIFREENIKWLPKESTIIGNAQFFTDVENVKDALEKIFEGIVKYSNYEQKLLTEETKFHKELLISCEYLHRTRNVVISIVDTHSHYIGPPDYLFNSGDFDSIRNFLWSLCNWEIQACFSEGKYLSIDMMTQNKEYTELSPDFVKGFTHKLTFFV